MRIYLCARYSRREEMLVKARSLEHIGHEVTSTWIDGNHQAKDIKATPQEAQAFAMEDCADLARADTAICFTEKPRQSTSRGGRHVEMGLALGLGKRVIVVGPLENVFCCLPQVEHFESWEICIAWLQKEQTNAIPA